MSRLLVAIGAVAAGACGDVVDVQEFRVVGVYNPHLHDRGPEVPVAMNAGVPSEMTIWTRGNGCVRGGDTEVAVDGRTAVVTPYDFVEVGDFGCFDIGRVFEHKVNLSFADPGIWNIVFRYSTWGGPPEDRRVDGWDVYPVEVLQ